MQQKYYLDTSIFIDYYENRSDRFRPLGEWAQRLLAMIQSSGDILLISDILISELKNHFPKDDLNKILTGFYLAIEHMEFDEHQLHEARILSRERNVPVGDALHAIISRDCDAILVTRDKHFLELTDISAPKKPEDLI